MNDNYVFWENIIINNVIVYCIILRSIIAILKSFKRNLK